jgi:transcriptional regulator with GAF, ATPase, and Fis domain
LQSHEIRRVGDTQPQYLDVRVLAATNRDLQEAMQEGRFREDLYYRLNTFHLLLPPLRERKPALPNLIKYFILKNKDAQGKEIVDLEPAALYALTKYSYPGNIRELENIIEHATVLAEGGVIRLEDLPEEVQAYAREQTMAIPHIKGDHNAEPQVIEAESVEVPGISFESGKSEKKAAAETKDERRETIENAQNAGEQLSAEGAKAAGLAGQAASSETNAITEEQNPAQQSMPQSALPGTRPTVRRTYLNPAVAAAAAAHRAKMQQAQQAGPKLGRNDPCWCGSGLKYKKCHGKDLE